MPLIAKALTALRVKSVTLDGEGVVRRADGVFQFDRMRAVFGQPGSRLKVYLIGVVRGLSLVSRTKTASSFAGSVLLALRLIEWIAPGGSDQLSPAR